MTKKFIEWFILIWNSLLVFLIVGWILIEFYEWKDSIIAAIIAFIGAIFGGAITYIGVNRTLKHRDREIFLSDYGEKLMIMDEFEETYSKYLNSVFFIKNSSNLIEEEKTRKTLNVIKSLYEQLTIDRVKIYKVMDYNDSIEILNFYKKSLKQYISKSVISREEADKCADKISSIFQVFQVSKSQIEKKYRQYRKEL